MTDQQQLEDYYRLHPQAETPPPTTTNNDVRIAHEVAKKNASK